MDIFSTNTTLVHLNIFSHVMNPSLQNSHCHLNSLPFILVEILDLYIFIHFAIILKKTTRVGVAEGVTFSIYLSYSRGRDPFRRIKVPYLKIMHYMPTWYFSHLYWTVYLSPLYFRKNLHREKLWLKWEPTLFLLLELDNAHCWLFQCIITAAMAMKRQKRAVQWLITNWHYQLLSQ